MNISTTESRLMNGSNPVCDLILQLIADRHHRMDIFTIKNIFTHSYFIQYIAGEGRVDWNCYITESQLSILYEELSPCSDSDVRVGMGGDGKMKDIPYDHRLGWHDVVDAYVEQHCCTDELDSNKTVHPSPNNIREEEDIVTNDDQLLFTEY